MDNYDFSFGFKMVDPVSTCWGDRRRGVTRRMTEPIGQTFLHFDDVVDITGSHSLMLPLRHRYTYVERESTQFLSFDRSGASLSRNHLPLAEIGSRGNTGNMIGPRGCRDRSWSRRGVVHAPFGPIKD